MGAVNDTLEDNVPLQRSESNDVPDSRTEVQLQNVTLDVFFDGTGNNMFNTDLRKEQNPSEQQRRLQRKLAGQISFDNDYSNIVHLYKASTVNKTKKSIYIQGAGTIKEEKDANWGLAGAWGESGILDRVKDAFMQAQIKATLMRTARITFNVYGFSRGAFYGRYFVAMLKETLNYFYDPKDGYQLHARTNLFHEINNCGRNLFTFEPYFIDINFVGIYDTVTSEGTSPNNDAIPFRLNIGSKQEVNKIFHLTAQDEFRNHFPLAEINTAITQKNRHGKLIGFECSIPGAHADIGGGYTKPWDKEQDLYLSRYDPPRYEFNLGNPSEIHWSWFENKGYYTSNNMNVERKSGTYGEFIVKREVEAETTIGIPHPNLHYNVYATRFMPGNEYQFIGLNLMYEVAKQEGGVTFYNPAGLTTLREHIRSVETNPDLKDFNSYALEIIKRNVSVGGKYNIKMEDCHKLTKQQQQAIYHKYIHNTLIAKMIWEWEKKTGYIVNGSDRSNKDANFRPRRIITKDDQGWWGNIRATNNSPESN